MASEVIRTRYLSELLKYKDVNLIKVITGMRRVGKSYLLRQFRSALESQGISKDSIVYIDMDSMSSDRYRDGRLVYSEILELSKRGRLYILIDEVQLISEWVRVVESLRNDIDCDIYITGSNAHMLSSDIATLLTGRSVTITVLPLSLKESCELYGDSDPKSAFIRYYRHGGLPILRPEYSDEVSFRVIDELKSDIIVKDICTRKPGTDAVKIRKVIDYLYSEVGNPISITKISDALGISATAVGKYLQLITDSMLFMKVDRYDLKGKSVLSQEPKYYCTDTGMRYSQSMSKDRDFGKTLENIVYQELIRRGCRVYVGRQQGDQADKHLEIDFIVMKEDSNDYYQVTQTLSNPDVYEREFKPLSKISGRGERYVITYDDRPIQKGPDAIVMNIVDFLMMDPDEGSGVEINKESGAVLYEMVMDYIEMCRELSGTIVTRENFDRLSGLLQERFFDLQAYFNRPDLIEDPFLQDQLVSIRKNNVRIFNAMIASVNANKEPVYCPQIGDEVVELTDISKRIDHHIASSR